MGTIVEKTVMDYGWELLQLRKEEDMQKEV